MWGEDVGESIPLVPGISACRENYAGKVFEALLLADLLQHIEPAEFRHHEVE